MNKHWILALPALLAAYAFADPAADLMSAQAAYRQALQVQNSSDSNLLSLQSKLSDAEQRKANAENDITRYRAELQQASQIKAANDATLKAAGDRLNAMWQAAQQAGILAQ